jgi:hypothetical protein
MTLPKRPLGAAAIAATAVSFAIPGSASATAGQSTFQQTFPVASRLCENVAAGKEGKHLRRFAKQVLADCTTLHSAFTAAQIAVLVVRATTTVQIAAERGATAAACPTPKHQPPACRSTRHRDGAAIDVLRRQMVNAARRYYTAIETARRRFWRAIRGLPGERHVRADAPIPVISD